MAKVKWQILSKASMVEEIRKVQIEEG